ncbi:hypothetical protein [Zobellella endophytica]|uniref:hypothetical protein n=1 Tax=Zobellella endophytica TaxID=2116700 RepID=UPI0011B208AE|nr:hypothetical protein [Zobellella endophytica]
MNTKKRTLYIHIGANKNGSTTLQKFLASNQDRLLNDNVVYPKAGLFNSAHYHISDVLGYGPKLNRNERLDIISEVKQELESTGIDNAVISSEYFILSRSPESVKKAFQDYNIKIIIYLRRHDLWLESLYNQAVKTTPCPSWDKGIKSFISNLGTRKKQHLDYKVLLELWSDVFGRENIIVRPFERMQFKNGSLYDDFLDCIKVSDATSYIIPKSSMNTSVPVKLLDLIDSINRKEDINTHIKNITISKILSSCEIMDEKKVFNLNPSERLELIEQHQESYCFIAKEYLSRENGALFYEPLPSKDEPWDPPPEANLNLTLDIITKLCSNQP